MKIYVGRANDRNWTVDVETYNADGELQCDSSLRNRTDLRNHSPDGFAWGYGGSGPAQLAISLLADALGDDERARRLYQHFKWQYLSPLDHDANWAMSETIVRRLADIVEKEDDEIRARRKREFQNEFRVKDYEL